MTSGGESIWSILFKFVNFAVLVAILVKFGAKPLKDFLVKRRDTVREKIDEANRVLADARQLKQQYEEKLSGLDAEMEIFRKTIMSELEQEKAKIAEETEQFTLRIKEQARITAEQEIREVRNRIKAEIVRLTMEKAEKLIAEKISKTDHDRMVDDFIAKLRSMN